MGVVFEEIVFEFWICTCFSDGKLVVFALVIKTLVADLVTTLFELKFELLFEEVVDITGGKGNEFDVF